MVQVEALRPVAEAFKAMAAETAPRLVFVSTSDEKQTEEFLKDFPADTPFPGELILDVKSASHKVFQLNSGIWSSIVSPIASSVGTFGLKGIWAGIQLGMRNRKLAGNSWMHGGTFVISHDAKLLFSHVDKHPTDWADISQVLDVLHVKLGEDIDRVKALQRWEKMQKRAENLKCTNGQCGT